MNKVTACNNERETHILPKYVFKYDYTHKKANRNLIISPISFMKI